MLNVQSLNFNQNTNKVNNKQSFKAVICDVRTFSDPIHKEHLLLIKSDVAVLLLEDGKQKLAKALTTGESIFSKALAKIRATKIAKRYPDRILTEKDLAEIASKPSSIKYPKVLVLCDEAKTGNLSDVFDVYPPEPGIDGYKKFEDLPSF